MSVSQKNIPKISKLFDKTTFILRERKNSSGKSHNHLSLKYSLYINKEKKINTNLCILNLISNESERKYSIKTSISESNPNKYNYELHMINKYDEYLNSSLSFISEFDLEKEEIDDNNFDDSFDSCGHDDSEIEQIEIQNINRQIVKYKNYDEENDVKLEKEWNDIQNFLLNK